MILGLSLLGGWSSAETPFCEYCDEWADTEQLVRAQSVADREAAKQLKLASSVEELLNPLEEVQAEGMNIEIHHHLLHCPRCDQTNFLTVKEHVMTWNKKGEHDTNTTELFSNVKITPADARRLKDEEAAAAKAFEEQLAKEEAEAAENPAASTSEAEVDRV